MAEAVGVLYNASAREPCFTLPADPNSPDGASEYVAYATYQKVVGLMQLPLDGNPNKAMGLIAHPGEVSAMAVTHDGRYMLTAGGSDLTVNLWSVNTQALDDAVAGDKIGGFENFLANAPILEHVEHDDVGLDVDDWLAESGGRAKEIKSTKMGRTESMNRVASLERMAKRVAAGFRDEP